MNSITRYQFQETFTTSDLSLNVWLDYIETIEPSMILLYSEEKKTFHHRGEYLIIVYYKSVRKGFFKRKHIGWKAHRVDTYKVIK